MPLFGGSKKSESEKSQPTAYGTPYGSQAYPQAPQGGYPQAQMGAYPQAPSGAYPQSNAYPAQGYASPAGAYGVRPNEPPPPYTSNASGVGPYPTAAAYPTSGAPPMYQQTQQMVYLPNCLDSGARVGPMTSQAIPPAPPGCPPNAAQVAAMQGHHVVLGQRKDNWFTGGEGGGYTWW